MKPDRDGRDRSGLAYVETVWVGEPHGWRASGCSSQGPALRHPRWTPAPDLSADDAVVFLLTEDVSSECTGILVGERSVLTAAHCVEDSGPRHVRVGAREVPVLACAVHPLAYPDPRACGAGVGQTNLAHDLAVLTLEEAVDVPPVPLLFTAPELAPGWWRQRRVRLVGWDRRPRFVGPLERRSGMNRIVRLARGGFVTEPTTRSGFATIIGDSGGPALLRIDGTERVAGVLSGGTAPGSRLSVYVSTFEPENARWLLAALPPEIGRDLIVNEAQPFGPPSPLGVRAGVPELATQK